MKEHDKLVKVLTRLTICPTYYLEQIVNHVTYYIHIILYYIHNLFNTFLFLRLLKYEIKSVNTVQCPILLNWLRLRLLLIVIYSEIFSEKVSQTKN